METHQERTAAMIDKYDIGLLQLWLKLAKTQGTDAIKITAGEEPGTWTVRRPPRQGGRP